MIKVRYVEGGALKGSQHTVELNEWVRYLWDLTQAGDLACVGVYSEEHRSGLRGLRLQQLQRLI